MASDEKYKCPACDWKGNKLKTSFSTDCMRDVDHCPDCGLYKPFLEVKDKEVPGHVIESGS